MLGGKLFMITTHLGYTFHFSLPHFYFYLGRKFLVCFYFYVYLIVES